MTDTKMVTEEFRSQFLQWAEQMGAAVSPYVSFRQSKLGGTGVFFALRRYVEDNGTVDSDEQKEVIRVPKKLSYSLDSFMTDLLPSQREFDASLGDELLKQSEIITKFLENFQHSFEDSVDASVSAGINETNIIVGQVQMLMILKETRQKLISRDSRCMVLNKSPFAFLDNYTELLKRTNVPATRVDMYYDQYLEMFKYNEREYRHRIERLRFDAIYDTLKEFGIDYQEDINDKFLRKVELSVVSRLLEIPEALPTNSTTDGSECPEEYGFSVSSTLVPIIDFVNHSNDHLNAFFDVDPETDDILLRLYNEEFADQEEFSEQVELFIRYSDYEDVLKFVHSYGFIPRGVKVQPIYEHPIDREYLNSYVVKSDIDGEKYEHNLGLLLKWLQIQPNVQFVMGYNAEGQLQDVKMNLDENFIVFGFVQGLTYFKEAALGIVKHYSELQDDEYIAELLTLEESGDNDVIGGYETIPYSSVFVDGAVNLDALVSSLPDDEINVLMVKFIVWFVDYSQARIDTLISFISTLENRDSTVCQFADFEKKLLEKFTEQVKSATSDEQKLDLIIGAEDLDEGWLKHRLRPRAVKIEDRIDLYSKYMACEVDGLKIT